MDLNYSASELDFQARVRAFLAEHLPADMAARTLSGGPTSVADIRAWQGILHAHGWGAIHWPVEFGGLAATPVEQHLFQMECALAGAPQQVSFGVKMLAPVLMRYGSREHQQYFLPRILSGEHWWCQGYSEPGSGSDLASLQTRAEDKGDHYLVNGQKIWTSGANLADWCFCLVRTDTAKKHEGISFLLINMRTAGVEVRPILLINGTSPFCETFFTDVVVPKNQLFGPLNGGWTVAKRLLQFERDNISAGLGGGSIGAPVQALTVETAAKDYVGLDETGRLSDTDFRRRVTEHLMEVHSFQLTVRRAADEARSNQGPSAATSIMKYAGAKVAQDRNELIVEALGANGLGWEGEAYSGPELAAVRTWLRSKGNSIEGGTSEINLNVVSKRVLGLPDPK